MRRLNDLTGQVFGRLKVLSRSTNIGKQTRWLCACLCGKQVSVNAYRLRNGDTQSCGCISIENSQKRAKDITGLRVGRLLVLRRLPSLNTKSRWECMCECGALVTLNYQHLKDAQVKSCGCYGKEVSAKNGKIGAAKHSGANSHLYNPSLTDEDRLRIRSVVELREWRQAVFVRDNYTCDLCGKRGGRLEAHHLNDWATYPLQRFLLKNGITLCKEHHKEFHHKMGTRNSCTGVDYESFKTEKQHAKPAG